MSNICRKCGTTFDSPFCPNCGTQAQQPPSNQQSQPLPPPIPPNVPTNQYNPYNNAQPLKKKHGCLFWGVLISAITIGVILFSIVFISCMSSFTKGFKDGFKKAIEDSKHTAANEEFNVEDAKVPSITDAATQYLTEDEIPYLYSSPDDYIGKHVKLSGIIFGDPEKKEDGTYFQMFQDAVNCDNNTIIAYYGDLDIQDGDYVLIDGVVDRNAKGENAFGATLNAPGIVADKVEICTYQDVVSPTIKTIKVDETQKQYDYEITVEKVEFSPIETRVYITINNNGTSEFTASSYNMKLIQGNKQYEEQANYEADYPEVQIDLIPGTSTSGIVCFPVISQKDNFSLYIEGYSDNWEETVDDFIFDIIIKKLDV